MCSKMLVFTLDARPQNKQCHCPSLDFSIFNLMNSSMSTGLESLLNHVHLLLVIFSRVGLQGISRRAKLFTILTVKSRSRQMLGFNMILTSCVVFRYIITVSASETSIRSTDHLLLYCTIKGCKCITICYQSSVVLKDSINFIKIKDMIQKYSC